MQALEWLLLCFSLIQGLHGQAVVTPAPPQIGTATAKFDAACKDALENCAGFGSDACKGLYEAWARDNCALTCGYCVGPPTTPPPCVDVLNNCESYDPSTCTNQSYSGWAKANCRRTCRLCPAEVLAALDAHTTTLSPDKCVDKVDCRLYTLSACSDSYKAWAKDNCPNFCGFCVGLPTPPAQCADSLPNCDSYEKAMCSAPEYKIWAEENCRKTCNFCTGGGPIVTHPTLPPATTLPKLTPPHLILTPPPLPPGRK
ncbi:hypothetical protein C0Q70_10271 [Pomacea canaliculata]|uniref:ShKT domain-containing protein n=1 Tax=Pomacea canaliculata TaxID=400727 RepID=A0A2T7PC57_POMCA|nr:uncharacterized protein ZK643.6-like [Pomacea canaliculata]PVD30995.1 hypothetical protein C0Q70_10271 [Pomacea canaliculata]